MTGRTLSKEAAALTAGASVDLRRKKGQRSDV